MRLEKRLVELLRNQSELLDTMDVDQEQKLLILFLGPDGRFLDVVVLSEPLCGAALAFLASAAFAIFAKD